MSWFEDWFNTPYYHILYKDRDFVEAESFITNLTNNLQLPQHSKIIDLACGKGRHSVFLNKLGYNVLGVDLSTESISFAQKDFGKEHLQFKIHDMRNELYPDVSLEKVNAVFNLFTSFGYFDDENDNKKVFQSVKNVLEKDGIFILDFLNERFVKNTLVEESAINKGGIDFTIKKRIEEKFAIKVLVPNTQDIKLVHNVIYKELCLGVINEKSRNEFLSIMERLVESGAEAVILGCTEIGMLIKQEDTKIKLFDTTQIHAKQAVIEALK